MTDDTKVIAASATVELDDASTVAELNAIAPKAGVITGSIAATSLASLSDLATAGTDVITITVNDGAGSGLSATDLSTLGGKTAGTVTVSNAVVISGTTSQVTAALVTDDTKVTAGSALVTISAVSYTHLTLPTSTHV